MRLTARVATLLAALLFAGAALAAGPGGYPNKPVKVVVPFAPAGPTDVMARLIAQKLSEALGQQFYVENHAGAGGNLGMSLVAKAPADGYTILVASSSYVVNPSLYAKNPYDPYKDFAPVTLAAASPNIVVVHPDVPVKSMKELVDYIKANPAKSSIANPGVGTTPQLAAELFKLQLKLDATSVPFGGAGPAIQSAVALAVTSAKRSVSFPDVPTLEEAGMKNQESETMQGVFLPGGAPKELVDFLNAEIAKVMAMQDVKEKCAQLGFDVVADKPDRFAAYIKGEVEKWAQVIRDAKIAQIP
jgi:tripartite-type tricarboxylate transporter receptor subunit TctC